MDWSQTGATKTKHVFKWQDLNKPFQMKISRFTHQANGVSLISSFFWCMFGPSCSKDTLYLCVCVCVCFSGVSINGWRGQSELWGGGRHSHCHLLARNHALLTFHVFIPSSPICLHSAQHASPFPHLPFISHPLLLLLFVSRWSGVWEPLQLSQPRLCVWFCKHLTSTGASQPVQRSFFSRLRPGERCVLSADVLLQTL